MQSAASPDPGAVDRCLNCDEVVGGKYCSACGQLTRLPSPKLWHFLMDWLQGLFKFDGKTLQTLRLLLTKPGFLTVEFWRGRRARYTEPKRLYLFASIVYFAVYALVPITVSGAGGVQLKIAHHGASGLVFEPHQTWIVARAEKLADLTPEARHALIRTAIHRHMPAAVFALVPFFAALLALLFRRNRRTYLEHLTFGFHVHALIFLALLPSLLWRRIELAGYLIAGAYILVALRRAYGRSIFATGWRGLLAITLYGVVVAVAVAAVVLASIEV